MFCHLKKYNIGLNFYFSEPRKDLMTSPCRSPVLRGPSLYRQENKYIQCDSDCLSEEIISALKNSVADMKRYGRK